MIERSCDLLEALSGSGRPEAVDAVARARGAGASADAVARAVEALVREAESPRAYLGSPSVALALSSVAAAIAGAYGLRALVELLAPGSRAWAWPLAALPLALLGLSWALRGGSAGPAWSARAIAAREVSLVARGLPAEAATVLVAFVVGDARARSRATGARWAPWVLAAGAAVAVFGFWVTYFGLVTAVMAEGGVGP